MADARQFRLEIERWLSQEVPQRAVALQKIIVGETLTKIVGELSLELHQAREELTSLQQVPHIGAHSSAQPARAWPDSP